MTETLSGLARFDQVGWWGVIDIVIVSLLIYELLKLVRRTHAVQIMIGGGLIILLYYASQFTPLQTLNWLVRDMFGYVVFAAIGLTEETDAVALVVSEETGYLSLVVDGQIEQNLESEQIRYRLAALVLHPGATGAK